MSDARSPLTGTSTLGRARAGLGLFVALSFLGSWFVAATFSLFALTREPAPLGTQLFTTSLLYAASMGWQPLAAAWFVRSWIDPPDGLDLGLRPSAGGFAVVGVLGALLAAAAAMLVAQLAAVMGWMGAAPLNGTAEAGVKALGPSLLGSIQLCGAFFGALFLVWLQAFTEELGWRGYFLPRAMETCGRWTGLVLQGVLWGVWYAPVLYFASHGQGEPLAGVGRCLVFVVTCALLGTLFGWLRLASESLVPVLIANSTLTLVAGLPYVVHHIDAGLRAAVFGPAGWVVFLLVIAGLLTSRWRHAVRVPPRLSLAAKPPLVLLIARQGGLDTRPSSRKNLH